MQKKIFKNLTFLPICCISLKLEEYVSTYAGPLKFSKLARERCYIQSNGTDQICSKGRYATAIVCLLWPVLIAVNYYYFCYFWHF